jgi:hypothetical protein
MFALLQGPDDWQTFQGQFLAQMATSKIEVGAGFSAEPVNYPCLADVFAVPGSIQCCFVYRPDAARLLLAAEMISAPPPSQPAGIPQVASAPQANPSDEDVAETLAWTDQQEAMNRHVSAMLLAIVELLVDTSIIKPPAFEQRLIAAQRTVDELLTEKKDRAGIDQPLNESVNLVLKRLGYRVEDR